MFFTRLTPEEQYHRVLSACDWCFRLRVLLVDGAEVHGEYAAFSGTRKRVLTLWDEHESEIEIPVRKIIDVVPPSQPLVGCI